MVDYKGNVDIFQEKKETRILEGFAKVFVNSGRI
jgi:hypothetical protein